MGLYNMLMGRNPFASYLLAALEETEGAVGRMRDVYTNDAGDRIFILTRNYGEEWAYVDEAIAMHPTFISKNDTSDETYTVYEFGVPKGMKRFVHKIATLGDNTPAMERYTQAVADMVAGKQNAQTQHMEEVGKKIMGSLMEAMDKGENKVVSNEFGSVEIKTIGGI